MDIFASDLDNTLIYSYKRQIGTDKILAERYEGREVSYMTAYAHDALDQIFRHMLFVPVTTRSVEQYQRIWFSEVWTPELALTTNGGVLLVDGQSDPQWYAESKQIAERAEAAMQQAEAILEADPNRTLDVRRVDGLFVYSKSTNVPETMQRLRQGIDLSEVELFDNGVKIYVLPRALNKGEAVRRLRARFSEQTRVFAAGDSLFDLPLLAAADTVFYPQNLAYTAVQGQQVVQVTPEQGVFSDIIFRTLISHLAQKESNNFGCSL